MCTLGVVYSERYANISTTPLSLREVWTTRIRLYRRFLEALGSENILIHPPDPADESDLMLAHTKRYISYVKAKSAEGRGSLDYGDTPAYRGVYEDALALVGGSLTAVKLVLNHIVDHAFAPNGGFHHAETENAGGFCVFNDLAISARFLSDKGFKRIAIVDIDGHHGNGTQEILYEEPILKISFHRYGPGFYPGSGWVDEVGKGRGYGYSVNVPLPLGAGDDVFIYAFKEIAYLLLRAYKPDAILCQLGVDGHVGDPLVGLRLTSKSYIEVYKMLHGISHDFDSLLVGFGGGGYQAEPVAKAWLELSSIWSTGRATSELELEGTKSKDKVWRLVSEALEKLKEEVFPIHNL